PISNSDTAEVRVKNCSVLPTTFTGTLSAPLPGYSIIGGGNSVTVAAGDTAVFMLAFTPSLQGRDTGTFTVTTPGVGPMVVQLLGAGTGLNIVITATVPNVQVGNHMQFNVKVENPGTITWTAGNATISGPDSNA